MQVSSLNLLVTSKSQVSVVRIKIVKSRQDKSLLRSCKSNDILQFLLLNWLKDSGHEKFFSVKIVVTSFHLINIIDILHFVAINNKPPK